MTRADASSDVLAALGRAGIVAVVRTPTAAEAVDLARAALAGGIQAVEIALTTDGALDALAELRAELPTSVLIGAGTVLDVAQLDQVLAAGASFVMSPVVDVDVITAATAAGTIVVPGASTPTEVGAALRAGAPAVKLFPAATVGTAHLAALRQVFPEARFVPTGGIGLDDVDRWRTAGAFAVGVGGVLDDARRRGGLAAARELSGQLTQKWVVGNTRPLGDG